MHGNRQSKNKRLPLNKSVRIGEGVGVKLKVFKNVYKINVNIRLLKQDKGILLNNTCYNT